ncbi:g324 [Coccomyxa viridis]|uniref:G324 protein n=1 Tax=Coccomyxa viridis TaxID=1274662 RepID=A0ABP1FKM2_9CHLO
MSPANAFYMKVAGLCFVVGGCMEGFMIKTGFYDKVTVLEAQRLDDSREDREAFKRMLREEVERQAQEKHIEIHLPDDKS